MASSKEYLQYVSEQLSHMEGISHRAMMGEYIIYCRGVVVGGIYDDRLLLKPTKSAISYIREQGKTASYELPYDGAKEMLFADELDNREFLTGLVSAVFADLSAEKSKK